MRLIVDKDVIDASSDAANVTKLHRLFGYAVEGRHVLIAKPNNGFEKWLAGLDNATREAYELALQLSARTATTLDANCSTIHIQLTDTESWGIPISFLSLEKAIPLLDQPLGILVENAANDWHFLRRIMRPSELKRLKHAIEHRWAEILHGGGADLVKRLKDRGERPETCLQTFVVFDSDRRHPDELDSEWLPTGGEACQGYINEVAAKSVVGNRYWRLNRRFIESYLPRSELEAKAADTRDIHKDAVEAFFRMPTDARWYFNMKRGFKGDAAIENIQRVKNLYANIDASDKVALQSGFGRGLADQYKNSNSDVFHWDADALNEASTALPRIMRLL